MSRPRILVLYGTTDGQTATIARALADTLALDGAAVDVVDAASREADPADYDGIVVAASIHAGGYQRTVRRWVRRYARILDGKPTAFVSVCLAVLQRDDPQVQHELAMIVDRFLTGVDWTPGITKSVAGALPYSQYNWVKRWVMKRIVRKAGGDTDTTRDYEYTDWADVRAFAQRFSRLVRERGPSRRVA